MRIRILSCVCLVLFTGSVFAERIKDLAAVAGVRDNPLFGYGIVMGLDGTGDQTTQTPFTVQSVVNMLTQLGVRIPEGINPQLKNAAAVMVQATLPAHRKPGQTIDVTVSSIGNARSLRGGALVVTPLMGIDGNTYAIAQGNLVVGGFGADANDGSSVTVNVPTVGRIPNGAIVEVGVPTPFGDGPYITLNLHRSDFTTANRIVQAIDDTLGPESARALDSTSVQVVAPGDQSSRVAFMSFLENIEVQPGEAAARVIVNSRTGTVVIGSNVRVSPAAVTHGSLTVTISSDPLVSQPAPFSDGDTVVVPDADIEVTQAANRMFLFNPGVALDDIVRSVNEVGASPGDLVAILEALKEAGALRAELIII